MKKKSIFKISFFNILHFFFVLSQKAFFDYVALSNFCKNRNILLKLQLKYSTNFSVHFIQIWNATKMYCHTYVLQLWLKKSFRFYLNIERNFNKEIQFNSATKKAKMLRISIHSLFSYLFFMGSLLNGWLFLTRQSQTRNLCLTNLTSYLT